MEATAGQGALILKSDKDFRSVSPKLALGCQLRDDTRLYVGFAPASISATSERWSPRAPRSGWTGTLTACRIETRLAYNKAEFTSYRNPTNPSANLTGNTLGCPQIDI